MMKRSFQRGFTLIELMITVAIIGILAGVALPAYTDYVRRGSLPDAFTALSDYKVKMEQYFQDHRSYGSAGCADTDAPAWGNFTRTDGSGYFTFSCTLSSSTSYKITATGAKKPATGHVYAIDQDGNRTTEKFKGASSTKGCWLAKGDEC